MGMDEEGLSRLFQDFVQVNETITRKFGGTGMGLSICKQLAELMGGRIYATSQLGVGTTFSFEVTFSLDPAAALDRDLMPDSPLLSPAALPHPFSVDEPPHRTLVVSGCAPIRGVLAAYLSSLGQLAELVPSVEEARAVLAGAAHFDVVVVDDAAPLSSSSSSSSSPPSPFFGGRPAPPPVSSASASAASPPPGLALLADLVEGRFGPAVVPVLLSSANRRRGFLTPTGALRSLPATSPNANRRVGWLGKPVRLGKLAQGLKELRGGAEAGPAGAGAGAGGSEGRAPALEAPEASSAPEASEGAAGAERAGTDASNPPAGPKPRILLVEDQAFNQKVVEAMLRKGVREYECI
eukprot:tig00020562_g11149.t1